MRVNKRLLLKFSGLGWKRIHGEDNFSNSPITTPGVGDSHIKRIGVLVGNFETSPWEVPRIWFVGVAPGGGVLPYEGLTGMCGQPWCVFRDFVLIRVSILPFFVLNRVSFGLGTK